MRLAVAAPALLALLCVAGCASLNVSGRYQPPPDAAVDSSLTLPVPFDQAWDRLVRRLSQSYFQVTNISKSSHLITLAAPEDRAEGFVDCGRVTYQVKGQDWVVEPAHDATFETKSGLSSTRMTHRVIGRIGRMNIFVAPQGSGTLVEVNATYEVRMRQAGRNAIHNLLGDVTSEQDFGPFEAHFEFTTRTSDEHDLGGMTIRCKASGAWERQILDLAR